MKKNLPRSKDVVAMPVRGKKQFPSNLRFITEGHLPFVTTPVVKVFSVSFISGILLCGIVLQAVLLWQNIEEEKRVVAQRQQAFAEIGYWKQVADTHTDYRDVYYRIAALLYKVGKIEEAKNYIKKALELDPNFVEGRVLGAKIEKAIEKL